MIAFGPVPSRRLGRSLGINNIPPKVCTYSCVYCQVGRTIKMQGHRKAFYKPDKVFRDVQTKIEKERLSGETINYLTFVPDGEPTLDINLGREIELLKEFKVKIAVITNSSLIWRADVRTELMRADWVSLKVDSTQENIWRKINRPYHRLKLDHILKGIMEFSKVYNGELTTETMIVKDLNDDENHLKDITGYLTSVNPAKAYVSIPTRPPAEKEIQPPNEKVINRAYQIFSESLDHVEYLIGYEGNSFAFTGNVEEDILSISAVHPIRADAMKKLLENTKANWSMINHLIDQQKLIETEYKGHKFYLRRFNR